VPVIVQDRLNMYKFSDTDKDDDDLDSLFPQDEFTSDTVSNPLDEGGDGLDEDLFDSDSEELDELYGEDR
jgi:hypothetical protein